ncbi:myeloid leukemia factor 2-like isoform X1 [Lampetra planeri]
MFGLRDLDDDPFMASDPFRAHHERVRRAMQGFPAPMPLALPDARAPMGLFAPFPRLGFGMQLSPFGAFGNPMSGVMMNPFQMMDSMISNMHSMMSSDMHGNYCTLCPQETISPNPNGHSFSSTTVMSYSNMGDGPPRVYQASSQTHQVPGGVREVRRSVRDSESGLEKMSIGHHIGERAHIIERSRNHRTGNREENQDFINLEETEAPAFDAEFRSRTSQYAGGGGGDRRIDYRRRADRTPAIMPAGANSEVPVRRGVSHV